jgi:hypothetical protein
VAAHLKNALGVETELVRGGSGEFTVWFGGAKVIEKFGQLFPTPEECEAAVARAIDATAR